MTRRFKRTGNVGSWKNVGSQRHYVYVYSEYNWANILETKIIWFYSKEISHKELWKRIRRFLEIERIRLQTLQRPKMMPSWGNSAKHGVSSQTCHWIKRDWKFQ